MEVDSRPCTFSCGALEIGSFGGGEEWQDDSDEVFSKDQLITQIRRRLSGAIKQGYSVVFATTMSNQPHAAKALEALGFYTSKPFKRTVRHGTGRKMQAWFLPLHEYKKG